MLWLTRYYSQGLTCDPFCGSGTTLVACKQHSIPAIGIEIEERYCEIAVDRLRQGVLFANERDKAVASDPQPVRQD